MRITLTALPITLAGRRSPLGPRGIGIFAHLAPGHVAGSVLHFDRISYFECLDFSYRETAIGFFPGGGQVRGNEIVSV
jgi:hypothetical protein